MSASGLILLIPDTPDEERDALATAWESQGGEVLRLGRFWDPPALDISRVRVYGGTSFVSVLQQKLGFGLCTPANDPILSLPDQALKRRIEKHLFEGAEHFRYPLFVKPVVPKLFTARVYPDLAELRRECHGLAGDTALFTSDAVSFVAEARTFVLDGKVLDCALYEGYGSTNDAAKAAAHFSGLAVFPRALVWMSALSKNMAGQ